MGFRNIASCCVVGQCICCVPEPGLSVGVDIVVNESDTEPPVPLSEGPGRHHISRMLLNSHVTHFTLGETEAQRGAQVCLHSHARECRSRDSNLDSLCPTPHLSFPFSLPVLTQAENKHLQKALVVLFILCLFF